MFNHNKPERGRTDQLFFYTVRKSHVSPGEEELAEKWCKSLIVLTRQSSRGVNSDETQRLN